jgi:GNAT superfamily N-acetyltransferase
LSLAATTIDDVNSGIGRNSTLCLPKIRCLGWADEAALRRLLLALEPSARNERFNRTAFSLHTEAAPKNADWVLGAFVDDALCGVAEIYCDKIDGDADVALAVDRAWRSKGIGTALLHTMMQIAAEANTNKLRMLFSRRNWPMRRLAGKAGGRFDVIFDTISVEVNLFKLKQSSRARSSSVPQTATQFCSIQMKQVRKRRAT